MELTKDIIERIYSVIESSRKDGKIRKGVNEVTKSLERGEAQLSIAASDVSPSEIIQHLALLAKDKEIMHVEVPSKAELGASAGLPVATAAVAIARSGESKKKLKNLIEDIQILMKAEAEPVKEEKPTEEKKEESVEEKPVKKEAPKEESKAEKPAEEKKEESPVEEKTEETTEEKPAEEAEVESPVEEKTEEATEEKPAEEAEGESPGEEKTEEAESKEDKKKDAEEKTE